MSAIVSGLALGALAGGLFFGSLWFGVALMTRGAALTVAALQILRLAGLAVGLYLAARLGAPALIAAGGACLLMRQAALWRFAAERPS